MSHWSSVAPTVLASFMASMVEFVEALTIVLAVGSVRGWRSTLLGTAAGAALLLALVALLGPSLARIPLPVVQVAVGALLLMFGLRWLRKAVLRAAAIIPLHDEQQAFEAEKAVMLRSTAPQDVVIDRIAFATSFKIVMLEGIEVVFIVIAIGAGGPLLVSASIGAGLAFLVVLGLGVVVHRPLARVPENALKFGVGALLSAFGTFWVAEGIGLSWPGADGAVLLLVALYAAVSGGLVRLCRRWTRRRGARSAASVPAVNVNESRPFPAIALTVWALFVDDGWLAGGAIVAVAATWWTHHAWVLSGSWLAGCFALALNGLLVVSAARRALA